MTDTLPYLDASAVFDLGWAGAVSAVERAMLGGLDPAGALSRSIVELGHGQLLTMPAETDTAVGVKLTTLAPDNPAQGRPRVQALYVLYDPATLTPVALIDGTALTTLRTPAVSAVAVKYLARSDATTMVVFGSGPQAWGHVEALRAVLPVSEVVVVGRDPDRTRQLVERLGRSGLSASGGDADAVGTADVVVCATTAAEPVFDGSALRKDACVVAVGSHQPSVRELDDTVMGRAERIVVETTEAAVREAGDVILAIESGVISASDLMDLAVAVRSPRPTGLSVFKGVGMGWQDLVVAEAVAERWPGGSADR
ncbi:MAG: ornithine cyclodeaminase family protein [Microlunatus sp.]|nr:ornithine cyclodeaminase family protein [Microlunatus sp.]MDN5803514.1 ornithine cyclodeaminase family protein [Microlunatus sp.]